MIFEVCEVSSDMKEDEVGATIITTGNEIPKEPLGDDEDEDDDVDWETFNKVG